MEIGWFEAAYFALVYSIFHYGIISWNNSCHAEKVFHLQEKIIKLMCFSGYRSHCQPLFKLLDIIPVSSILIDIHKKDYSFGFHTYETWSANKIIASLRHLAKTSRISLNFTLYNHLPFNFRELSLSSFKFNISIAIFNKCFYSISEYFETSLVAPKQDIYVLCFFLFFLHILSYICSMNCCLFIEWNVTPPFSYIVNVYWDIFTLHVEDIM